MKDSQRKAMFAKKNKSSQASKSTLKNGGRVIIKNLLTKNKSCNHTDYFAKKIGKNLCCNNCGEILSKSDITKLKTVVKTWDKV